VIAILAILVDRQRSFWSSRLGESLNDFNLMAQDALRQGATHLTAIGFPPTEAQAAAVGLLHARLTLQSVVNAFLDTFRYQAALGIVALLIVFLFGRVRFVQNARRWIVEMVR